MLPKQKHPNHHHKENRNLLNCFWKTFIKNNNKILFLNPGDVYHVKRNTWHQFKAGEKGCIFEEISTRAIK